MLSSLGHEWERELSTAKSPRTVRNYTRALDRFAGWCPKEDPASWDSSDAVEYLHYLEDEGLATSTRRLHGISLTQFGDFLVRKRVWDRNRFRIDLPSKETGRKPETIEEEKLLRLLDFEAESPLEKRDRAMLWLMYAGALRASEVRTLRDSDLALDEGRIGVVGKGNKFRTVPLTDQTGQKAIGYLREYLEVRESLAERNEYVFWGRREEEGSDALSYYAVYYTIKRHLGEDASPHVLRRSRLTHLANRQFPPTFLRDFAGHESMDTTMHYYVKVNEDKMAELMASLG